MVDRLIDRMSSEQRKQFPMATGLLDYFPDALAVVSHISWLGNEKHNKGELLHHARGKSMDHPDCVVRHMSTRHSKEASYGDDPLNPYLHRASAVWRALADLQEQLEQDLDLTTAPGAWEADE